MYNKSDLVDTSFEIWYSMSIKVLHRNRSTEMASITEIKRRILELGAGQFQEFCDTLLHKMGYGIID